MWERRPSLQVKRVLVVVPPLFPLLDMHPKLHHHPFLPLNCNSNNSSPHFFSRYLLNLNLELLLLLIALRFCQSNSNSNNNTHSLHLIITVLL
jgi:hypothetical protein